MPRLDKRIFSQRPFSKNVCLTETFLIHRHLMFHILSPQHFRPMTAVRIYCTAIIKYNSLNSFFNVSIILLISRCTIADFHQQHTNYNPNQFTYTVINPVSNPKSSRNSQSILPPKQKPPSTCAQLHRREKEQIGKQRSKCHD